MIILVVYSISCSFSALASSLDPRYPLSHSPSSPIRFSRPSPANRYRNNRHNHSKRTSNCTHSGAHPTWSTVAFAPHPRSISSRLARTSDVVSNEKQRVLQVEKHARAGQLRVRSDRACASSCSARDENELERVFNADGYRSSCL
jgi:hypothetical protein